MTTFRIASDLHLEYLPAIMMWKHHVNRILPVIPGERDMVLILAGDIIIPSNVKDQYRLSDFLFSIRSRFRHVVYVPGNHEYYGSTIEATNDRLAHVCRKRGIHFLNNSMAEFDGVRVVGSTLWSNLDNPLDAMAMNGLADKNFIEGLSLPVLQELHHDAVRFLDGILSANYPGKTVVVSHHAPTYLSMAPQYEGDLTNCCYYSNLDRMLWDYPVELWVHGHTHVSHDYIVGDDTQSCRVVCNPRGYANSNWPNPGYTTKVIEIK